MSDFGKIKFVNTTATSVTIRNEKGYKRYILPTYGSLTVQGRVGGHWYAEVCVGDQCYELASSAVRSHELGMRITDHALRSKGVSAPPPLGQAHCIAVHNHASFPIDVMFIDPQGRNFPVGTLPAMALGDNPTQSPSLAL